MDFTKKIRRGRKSYQIVPIHLCPNFLFVSKNVLALNVLIVISDQFPPLISFPIFNSKYN